MPDHEWACSAATQCSCTSIQSMAKVALMYGNDCAYVATAYNSLVLPQSDEQHGRFKQ